MIKKSTAHYGGPKCFVEPGIDPLDLREHSVALVGPRVAVLCVIKFLKRSVTFLNYYKIAAH